MNGESIVHQEYDLGGERSAETHYYHMERVIFSYAEDGTRTGVERYNLRLIIEPGNRSAGEADKYTCAGFALQKDDQPKVTIPALEGWSYNIVSGVEVDEQGQMFGIPHVKFEGLTNSNDEMLEPITAYQIYDLFIGFRGFTAFAEPVKDLKRIGDKIIASPPGESPINLGSNIAEGSTFKNDEITLEFKGLSVVGGAPCAVLHFYSGEGSFTFIFSPAPNMEVKTVGGTHYWGDIYLDLASKWVKKAEVHVVDIIKATMGDQVLSTGAELTINTIKAVPKAEFQVH